VLCLLNHEEHLADVEEFECTCAPMSLATDSTSSATEKRETETHTSLSEI
jgi:hypothetical protein